MKKTNLQKMDSLRATVLRLLGMNKGFEEVSGDKQKSVHGGISQDSHYYYRKEIETAWLEAKRKKSEALIEWQNRRFIC